jgi:hypothetical protein
MTIFMSPKNSSNHHLKKRGVKPLKGTNFTLRRIKVRNLLKQQLLEFELAFNLGPALPKSDLILLRHQFNKIVNK